MTGASGFVGTYLVEKLIERGHEVIGLSRTTPYNKNLEFFSCDINDSERVKHIVKVIKPDQLYHLAGSAFIPMSYSQPIQYYNTLVNGTLNLYEAIRNTDYNCKILYVGSGEIYGDGSGVAFKETDLLHANNAYAGAKACADIISEQYANTYKLQIIRTRSFNHTGPGQSANFVCSNFAKQIAALELSHSNKVHVGNINVKRDFLDVRDIVSAYVALMEFGTVGEAYNVSANNEVLISDLLDYLISFSSVNPIKIEVDLKKVRLNDPVTRTGDNSKLMRDTGWDVTVNLDETMKNLLDYWRKRLI